MNTKACKLNGEELHKTALNTNIYALRAKEKHETLRQGRISQTNSAEIRCFPKLKMIMDALETKTDSSMTRLRMRHTIRQRKIHRA